MDGWTNNVIDIYIFCCPLGVSGPDRTVTCTDSQMKTVLNRSLVLAHYPTAADDMTATNVGMVSVRERGRKRGRGRERGEGERERGREREGGREKDREREGGRGREIWCLWV